MAAAVNRVARNTQAARSYQGGKNTNFAVFPFIEAFYALNCDAIILCAFHRDEWRIRTEGGTRGFKPGFDRTPATVID